MRASFHPMKSVSNKLYLVFVINRCNSTSYVIHCLQPGQTYSFRVRAKNIHGCSEPSDVSDPFLLEISACMDVDTMSDGKNFPIFFVLLIT